MFNREKQMENKTKLSSVHCNVINLAIQLLVLLVRKPLQYLYLSLSWRYRSWFMYSAVQAGVISLLYDN